MTDTSVDFVGMHFPNPFMLASAPPARNAEMINRAFAAGWGGAVTKTITLDPPTDLQPRLHPYRVGGRNLGMENIELISPMSLGEWMTQLVDIKSKWPGRPLWASIMNPPEKKLWQRLVAAVQETGVDALELNVSCPHGMPDKGMGSFIGQNAELTGEIVSWVKQVSSIPVVVKLTPNVTDIARVAQACKENGADALCAINTVSGLVGVDLDTLTPMPSVGGRSTYGGYSGPAVKPIALRCVSQIAKATGLPISGLGGVSSWEDAAELMAVGAGTIQVGTAVMWRGFGIIDNLNEGLRNYLEKMKFAGTGQLIGAALDKIVEFSGLSPTHRVHASVDDTCNGCQACITSCNDSGFQAITVAKSGTARIDPDTCDGCGLCVMVCPEGSIAMVDGQ